jgi:hypothetical protein
MAVTWAKHEILKPPTDEDVALMEPAQLMELWHEYHDVIRKSKEDPYRYGFVLQNWRKANEKLKSHDMVVVFGGNRSSKTTYGAWQVVDCLMKNPNSLIVCFAQNAELSVLVQQSAVYDQLPQEHRLKSLGTNEYISYTRQNGFTGNSFILPNGSRCLFKTYSQFQNNSTVLEGLELGSWEVTDAPNLGAWCDEYLGGPELLNTLMFRLVTRNAKCLLTFTPIDGYTETVRMLMDGAETLESKTADLLNDRVVPYVQKVKDRDAILVYFHTRDNPFSGYERMAKDLKACSEADILCRAYGIATKSSATKFPRFDVAVNVLPHDKMPKADDKKLTRYIIVDPAGSKNWFMLWIAVDETDTWYVYREWPDHSVGEWGDWKGNKWVPGPGCKGLGYGLHDYVKLINELETGEDIFERWMDPRLGKATYQSEDGASCLIDELCERGLWFQPAPGLEIEQGIQAIQTKLAWNPKQPQTGINRPHFYVSERCKNLIWALQEYTGEGGREEQPKDPIDCLRYAATVPIRYLDTTKLTPIQRFEKYY